MGEPFLEGTTFEIRVPGVAAETLRRATVQSIAPAQFRSERILVVDDEPLVRRAITRKLKHWGLDPIEMSGGFEALLHLSGEGSAQVSAVLLDLSMPHVSGEEVLASLAVTHPSLPVIVVTGHVPDGAALSAARA